MQEKDLVVGTQLHQLPRCMDGFIDHRLEQGGTMPDLQDRQSRAIEIKNGAAGFFKYFFWQNTGTRIEIMNHYYIFSDSKDKYFRSSPGAGAPTLSLLFHIRDSPRNIKLHRVARADIRQDPYPVSFYKIQMPGKRIGLRQINGDIFLQIEFMQLFLSDKSYPPYIRSLDAYQHRLIEL